METLHLEPRKWYLGRKPILQIKILQEIALTGETSGSKFRLKHEREHYNPEIYQALRKLESNKLIKSSREDIGRGKREKYYELTLTGLVAVVDENPTPELFWKGLISYSLLNREGISKSQFEQLYNYFEEKFFGYPSREAYFFQLNLFDKVLDKWLASHTVQNILSPFQIVLECLAINRAITLPELIEKTSLSKEELTKILQEYTMKADYSDLYYIDDAAYFDVELRTEMYVDFMNHMIVTVKNTESSLTYELSLLGILLTLSVIRYASMEHQASQHLENIVKFEKFHPFHMREYYDKVSITYKDTLPLIFGNWDSLKKILGPNRAYYFDLVIDKKARKSVVSLPLLLGGIKEIYDDIESLGVYTRIKLIEVHNKCLESLTDNRVEGSEINKKKTNIIREKLAHLKTLLNMSSMYSFLDVLETHPARRSASPPYFDEANTVSEMLRNEITIIFYLGMLNQSYQMVIPPFGEQILSSPEVFSPRKQLRKILREHPTVLDTLSVWMTRLANYQMETGKHMDELKRELKLA